MQYVRPYKVSLITFNLGIQRYRLSTTMAMLFLVSLQHMESMSSKKRTLRAMDEEDEESNNNNFLRELQDLIRPRLSDEPISLTILTAHAAERRKKKSPSSFSHYVDDNTKTQLLEQARQQELQLFEKPNVHAVHCTNIKFIHSEKLAHCRTHIP